MMEVDIFVTFVWENILDRSQNAITREEKLGVFDHTKINYLCPSRSVRKSQRGERNISRKYLQHTRLTKISNLQLTKDTFRRKAWQTLEQPMHS